MKDRPNSKATKRKGKQTQKAQGNKKTLITSKNEPQTELTPRRKNTIYGLSNNIIHWTYLHSMGITIPSNLKKSVNAVVINSVKTLKQYKKFEGFGQRVTSLAWHPTKQNTVLAGSKWGSLFLWNFENDSPTESYHCHGVGPGGSIQNMVFNRRDDGNSVYIVAVNGTFSLKSFFEPNRSRTFLHTADLNFWYTALDVSFSHGVALVGNNKGSLSQVTLDGKRDWEMKLHKQKITHVEFSPRDPCCFVTTSVDKLLKVWDIRKVKDKNSCLSQHLHDSPINCARFSRVDGGSLLTTDQHSQLRIYSCPLFSLKNVIRHPHRFFQHLSPIKASWHPLRDIAVVGRYPDPEIEEDDFRSIDFYDGDTGQLLHRHFHPVVCQKITCLNEFNDLGDTMVSGQGSNVLIWKPDFTHLKAKESSRNRDSESDDEYKENKPNLNAPKSSKRKIMKVQHFKVSKTKNI